LSLPRGSVVLVAYPNSDLSTFKKRPALVVQNDSVRTELPQVVLALITSRLSRTRETRVHVTRESHAGIQMGLLVDSVILCDVLQTVSHDAVLRISANARS
jgi:mRNA interferase MazF